MSLEESVLSTLSYHDIFDYPLQLEEIRKYLIQKKTNLKSLSQTTGRLVKEDKVGERKGYYFLKNRQSTVKLRKNRFKYSSLKLKKARLFAQLLKIIPTVKLVAVSGALTMDNSHKYDDIDLVIITQKGTLWTTRFFANLILFPFKRKPAQLQTTNYKLPTNNKACLNIFIDESALKISPQNLYTAHEICQMKPLWDREKTYSKFIEANRWVNKFLPNWQPGSPQSTADSQQTKKLSNVKGQLSIIEPLEAFSTFVALAEKVAKWGQLWYMKGKITTEKIGEHQLFFHPTNTQGRVLEEHHKRLKKLNITL